MTRKLPPDAFSYYAGLGPERSYKAVAKRFRVSKQTVTRRAVRENWQRRMETALVHKAKRAGRFFSPTMFKPQSRRTLADQAPSCGSGCCTPSPPQLPVLSHDEHGAGRR